MAYLGIVGSVVRRRWIRNQQEQFQAP